MNAQVLTTTTSASATVDAGSYPSARSVPVSLSESTWFFGQPRVSTQKRRATPNRLGEIQIVNAGARGPRRNCRGRGRRRDALVGRAPPLVLLPVGRPPALRVALPPPRRAG